VFSASADKTVAMWDVETGTRIRKFVGHTGPVNACTISKTTVPQWIISGSDDGSAKESERIIE
jgi:Prp8 binding protein